MHLRAVLFKTTVAISIAAVIQLYSIGVSAQSQPNVSVVHLNVQQGSTGQQLVLTPKGMLVPLPGVGVNGNVVEIYMGNTGGYWYVDRTGQTVDLTPYVQQLRAQTAQMQQVAPPQYAPYSNQSSSGSSSSGSSGVATAAAAGLGAMVGSSVSTAAHYSNVPYGTPMYYGAHGHPYYNDENGKNVFVNADGEVNQENVYQANQLQNYNQTQRLNQADAYQQQRQTNAQTFQSQNEQQREGNAQTFQNQNQQQRSEQASTNQQQRSA